MMEGPIATDYSELVRWHWFLVTDVETPLSPIFRNTLDPVPSWPEKWKPFLANIPAAISRTIPKMEPVNSVQEIKQIFLDLISQAENFIYVENHFFLLWRLQKL